jgi:integrase
MFNHAVALGLFNGDNPVKGVKRYKITKTMPEFLEESDVQALLEAAEAHSSELHWVFLLGLHAGLRKGEIVNARWEWFDFNKHGGPVIRIQRHDGFEIKDHEERSIPMSSKIAQALLPHAQPKGFLFGESPASGQRWRYRYEPRRAFEKVMKAAGVKRCNFLLLRHSFASWHYMKGTDISKVSRWLGHSDISITMEHYAGLKPYDKDIENF